MKKHLIIFILTTVFPAIVFSQTIINTENLSQTEDSLIISVTLDYQGTSGNVKTNQIDIAPSVIIIGKKNDVKLMGGYSHLSEANNTILESAFIHLRHNYKITSKLKTFAFYQLQFNEVLLLNKRELFGLGLRQSLIQKDSLKFDFGAGVMQENEYLNGTSLALNETLNTFYIRGSVISSFKYIVNKNLAFNNVLYYQPKLSDFNDFRILNDFQLELNISKKASIISTLTSRYDSQPPSILTNFDNNYSIGFKLTL